LLFDADIGADNMTIFSLVGISELMIGGNPVALLGQLFR